VGHAGRRSAFGASTLSHEFLALPFNVVLGLAAGMLGSFVEKEEIWSFTPFVDLRVYPLDSAETCRSRASIARS